MFGKSGNVRLAELMGRLAAAPSPELESEFFNSLLDSSLSLPSPAIEFQGLKFGPQVAAGGETLRLPVAEYPEGCPAALAFTGDGPLLTWRPAGCDTVEMRFPDLCRLVLSAGLGALLIDLGSPHCARVGEAELREFAQGRAPVPAGICRQEEIPSGTIEFEKIPQSPPEAMLAALRQEAEASPGIAKVYLAAAKIAAEPLRPLIILEPAAGADTGKTVAAFAAGAVSRLGGASLPDILPLTADSPLWPRLRERGLPVWERR